MILFCFVISVTCIHSFSIKYLIFYEPVFEIQEQTSLVYLYFTFWEAMLTCLSACNNNLGLFIRQTSLVFEIKD